MLRLISLTGEQIPLTEYKNLTIESVLAYGDKSLSFEMPLECGKDIKEEYYIRTQTDEYVIKELSKNGEGTKISAKLNVEELDGKLLERFDSTGHTLSECMNLALVGTGWTVDSSNMKKRAIAMTDCYVWDIIKQVIKTYAVELEIDSINKILKFKDHIGEDRGVYFSDQLNLISLDVSSDTHEYYTRIIPVGKDGLTIEEVNQGKNYLDNFQYSSKIRTYRWKDERYTSAQDLKEDGFLKLDDMSKPYKAYSCSILDLAESGEYDILEFSIGDTVTVLDSVTGTKEKQRIVKIVECPEDYSNNTCELANTVLSFEEMADVYEDTVSTVDNITVDNGTVDGSTVDSISTEQIYDFDEAVIKNAVIKDLQAEYVEVSGELTSVQATVGTLEATMATTTYLETNYAQIDLANVEAGSISTALIKTGAIGTAQIADGSITDAKIVELSANKLTAGVIDAEDIEVINLHADNITVGTINGAQIAPGAIDMTNLSTSLGNAITTAQSDAGTALTAANGKNRIYYQTTPPAGTAYVVNDLWFDTDDGNRIYTWNGTAWRAVEFGSSAIAPGAVTAEEIAVEVNNAISTAQAEASAALTNAGVAQEEAQTATHTATVAQTKADSAKTTADNANQTAIDAAGAASAAQTKADNATTVADTAKQTAIDAQITADSASHTASTAQTEAQTANQAALDAAGIANEKGKVIIQSTAPGTADRLVQNLWIDTTGNANTPKRWNGSAWVAVTDKAATDAASVAATARTNANTAISNAATAQSTADTAKTNAATAQITANSAQTTANTAKTMADTAKTNAATAQSTADAAQVSANAAYTLAQDAQDTATAAELAANSAQTTADGKNTVFYQTTTPTATGRKANDIWYDTDDGYKMYRFSGGAWTASPLGDSAIGSMDAGKITSGYISVDRLAGNSITAAKMVTNTITAVSGILADAVITSAKIADLAVTGAKIANATIGTAKIADAAITTAKIGSAQITNALIADATIDSAKIANINAGKITAGTLSVQRLEIVGSTGSIVYALNNSGGVTSTAVNTIDGGKVTPRTITADRIVAGAVTANEIAASTITGNKIVGNTITADKLSVTSLSAITANLGTVTAGIIKSANYASGGNGMQINLTTATFDSKYFKIASDGSLSITGGTFTVNTATESRNIISLNSNTWTTILRPLGLELLNTDRAFKSIYQAGGIYFYRNSVRTLFMGDDLISDSSGLIQVHDGTEKVAVHITGALGESNLRISGTANYPISISSGSSECSISYQGGATSRWVAGIGSGNFSNQFAFWCSSTGTPMRIVQDGQVYANGFNGSSLAEYKDNIVKCSRSALDIILKGEVYNYNLKMELNSGTNKLHYGLVIGDGYNTPDEILSSDRKGINLYDMVSITWKAVQELNIKVNYLEQQLTKIYTHIQIGNCEISSQ